MVQELTPFDRSNIEYRSTALQMYTQYLNNYNRALSTINALRDNKPFQEFIYAQRNLPGVQQDLMSFLIMPVQVTVQRGFIRSISD